MIILDVGSGNTLTSPEVARRMVAEISEHIPEPKRQKVILKAQLFESAPPNTPLDHETFSALVMYGRKVGFRDVTASVFDLSSLKYLLSFKPVWVKVACRPNLYWLIEQIPRAMFPIVSVPDWQTFEHLGAKGYFTLACVASYPATKAQYQRTFRAANLNRGISDHTANWDVWDEYEPSWYERHVKLSDTQGPDAGPFAVLPHELAHLFPERSIMETQA